MKQRIYDWLVPRSVRRRIYEANVRHYRARAAELTAARAAQQAGLNLSPTYIRDLRVVADREALLRTLPAGATVAQIGLGDDESARRILRAARPAVLQLCESCCDACTPAREELLRARFGDELASGRVQLMTGAGDSSVRSLADHSLDWVYIGHACSGERLLETLRSCRDKVRPGGLVVGGGYGVHPWGREGEFAMVGAVHEFCKSARWEMVLLTHEFHRDLHFAIRPMAGSAAAS